MLLKEAGQMPTVCTVVQCHVQVYGLRCHCLTVKDREASAVLSGERETQKASAATPKPHPKGAT